MLRERYIRVNPKLAKQTELDDWKAIPQLIQTAKDYDLDPAIDWIEKHWN